MLSTLGIHWHLQTIHFIHYIKPSKKLKKVGEKCSSLTQWTKCRSANIILECGTKTMRKMKILERMKKIISQQTPSCYLH